ncbi:hypothetical protein L7F22_002990 [Adiantum nelumboides]|nr:hypothetical protein [Adiantum nelumboides]
MASSRLLCFPGKIASVNVYGRPLSRYNECRQIRLSSTSSSSHGHSGIKSTLPSSSSPESLLKALPKEHDDGDRGYLAFTKASLFKLTLPLQPPSSNIHSTRSKASSAYSIRKTKEEMLKRENEETRAEAEESAVESPEAWELIADRGERISQIDPLQGPNLKPVSGETSPKNESDDNSKMRKKSSKLLLHGSEQGEPADDPAEEFDAKVPAHSVVFLLHSGQPLSYIASLIEAEGPGFGDDKGTKPKSITFHSRVTDSKRWSPSTSIGDFMRDAARIGSFAIRLKPPTEEDSRKAYEEQEDREGRKSAQSQKGEIEKNYLQPRSIQINVPSFEDRSRFLRSSLYNKTAEIERMAKIKADCDALARLTTRRFAIAGGVILGGWWVTVFSITFLSNWGWDLAEPLTYLTGLGTLMAGYTWFLVHNREVSYRAVLTETTTRRQQRLYIEKGLNMDRYEELIDECKELRKQIRKVAEDYDLEWDQSKGSSGHNKRALDIVEKREAQEKQPVIIKTDSDEEAANGSEEEKQEKIGDEKEGKGGSGKKD